MGESPEKTSEFQQHAGRRRRSLLGEFLGFLAHNKKWWLLPILVVMALLGLLVLLTNISIIAPFIYEIF